MQHGTLFDGVVREYFLKTWIFLQGFDGVRQEAACKEWGKRFQEQRGRGCVRNPCWGKEHHLRNENTARVAGPWRVRQDSVRIRSSGTPVDGLNLDFVWSTMKTLKFLWSVWWILRPLSCLISWFEERRLEKCLVQALCLFLLVTIVQDVWTETECFNHRGEWGMSGWPERWEARKLPEKWSNAAKALVAILKSEPSRDITLLGSHSP